jgi:hypothetical protein
MKANKWRPCTFKACGRTEHVGRARWDAKRGGWLVREMRPGYPKAPSLYGPSAVYSITWLSRAERDRQVAAVAEQREENARRDEAQRLLNAICRAIESGITGKRPIVDAAAKWASVTKAAIRVAWDDAMEREVIVRSGRAWVVSDDIPF